MRYLELMDRKVIGASCAATILVWVVGLFLAGMDPSETETNWIFGLALAAGFAVGMWTSEHQARRRKGPDR